MIVFCWSKNTAPDQLADALHVTLEVADDDLRRTVDQYDKRLRLATDDPVLNLFRQLAAEMPSVQEADLSAAVGCFKRDVFDAYKRRVRNTRKLEKQMIIRFPSKDLTGPGGTLGASATFRLLGEAGSVFGLPDNPDNPRDWTKHFSNTGGQNDRVMLMAEMLQRFIRGAILGGIDAPHNIPTMLGNDGTTLYRPVLTTLTEFNNDEREAYIYFIEIQRRTNLGSADTTKLLDGVDAICRFRFLFLEDDSQYSALNAGTVRTPSEAKGFCDGLMEEIYCLESDLFAAGLATPGSWAKYLPADDIRAMTDEWQPLRDKLYEECFKIIGCNSDCAVPQLVKELTDTLNEVRTTLLPRNSLLVRKLAGKLGELADPTGMESGKRGPPYS